LAEGREKKKGDHRILLNDLDVKEGGMGFSFHHAFSRKEKKRKKGNPKRTYVESQPQQRGQTKKGIIID